MEFILNMCENKIRERGNGREREVSRKNVHVLNYVNVMVTVMDIGIGVMI